MLHIALDDLEERHLVLRDSAYGRCRCFDPATIQDLATFENPKQLSQGWSSCWSTACR